MQTYSMRQRPTLKSYKIIIFDTIILANRYNTRIGFINAFINVVLSNVVCNVSLMSSFMFYIICPIVKKLGQLTSDNTLVACA